MVQISRAGNGVRGRILQPNQDFRMQGLTQPFDNLGLAKTNIAYFIKPVRRNISPQVHRPQEFRFTDSFIGESSAAINRATTTASDVGLDQLLHSAAADQSVGLTQDFDSVADLNKLNDYWKFVLVINQFNNKRMGGGSSVIVVVNGRCSDEPVLQQNGHSFYNPNCELYIEGKSVFQTYNKNAWSPNGGKDVRLRSSRGYGYQDMFDQVYGTAPVKPDVGRHDTDPNTLDSVKPMHDMYENTPEKMHYGYDVAPNQGLQLTGNPIDRVGISGPSDFDRRQQLPRNALYTTLKEVSTTIKERDTRRYTSMDKFEGAMTPTITDPTAIFPKLVENLNRNSTQGLWGNDQYGPSIHERITAKQLETEYGITDPKVLNMDNVQFFSGSDQRIRSTRGMFESLLATQLPVMMIDLKIHSISFKLETTVNSFGEDAFKFYLDNATPAVNLVSSDMLNSYIAAFKFNLETGILQQIRQVGGEFSLMAQICITSTSLLALNFADEPVDDHIHEFFPSDFAFTTPMVAKEDMVRNNQNEIGHFMGEIISRNNATYFPDDFSNRNVGLTYAQQPQPTARISTGTQQQQDVSIPKIIKPKSGFNL